MTKHSGTRYSSLWDWSTWLTLAFVAAAFLWPVMIEDDPVWQTALSVTGALFITLMIVMFKGIYYRIAGNNLIIYQFFRPTSLPIDKIKSVVPTKCMLASPATSFTNRLAVQFSDRKVLKSSMPVYISPVRQKEFIAELLSINPNIITDTESGNHRE